FYRAPLGGKDITQFQFPDLDRGTKCVKYFWASPNHYFWFDRTGLIATESIPGHELDAAKYCDMLRGIGCDDADDRRGRVEVSTGDPVSVASNTLIGLVVPRKFLSKPELIRLQAAGAIVKSYLHTGLRATEYFDTLRKSVYEMLVESGHMTSDGYQID